MNWNFDAREGKKTNGNQKSNGDTRTVSDRIRQRKPGSIPNHGTESEYSNYGCRCNECREAHNRKHREWKRKQRERT